MSHSANTSPSSTSSTAGQPTKQNALINFCHSRGMRTPTFQLMSDRRGGRTAWSCIVNFNGQEAQARFWYDGQYVNTAREDAAERALQMLGQMPSPQGPKLPPYTVQQRAAYGAGSGAAGR